MKTVLFILLLFTSSATLADIQPDASELIKSAINNFRGLTSYSEASMTIHRADWERTIKMKAWTEGLDKSLVRILAPIKDKGSGTLLIKNNMWSYTPKINRVIKIPSSMSNQSWMGSDFSNNDIARADDLIDHYTHTLINTKLIDGKKVYTIESIPNEDAPVVWGKEIVTVDENHVLLRHEFYDQDGLLVKFMTSSNIVTIQNRHVAMSARMHKNNQPDEWTEFNNHLIKFDVTIKSNTFTLRTLKSAR